MKIDWSEHVVDTVVSENFRMDWIHIPGSSNRNVKFINTNGIMAVTGDYGNWIFCREFHPSAGSTVSRGYMDEKLELYSEQKAYEYSPSKTKEAIIEFVEDLTSSEKEKWEDWIDSLFNSLEDYYEYVYAAYRETPSDIYCEDVPFREERHVWLDCVYDAFNEICNRLENDKRDIQQA